MARPKGGYKLSDGTRVPGTTTIIGRYKESGGLIAWAWKLGMAGIDYREERDAAASAGTFVHDLIEATILGKPAPEPEGLSHPMVAAAMQGYAAFEEWWGGTKIEVVETETTLISEEHRFGGTLDAIGRTPDGYCLLDWKASNRIYLDYLLQLAAYRHLWHEAHPDKPLRRFHLLRCGKEMGDFHHHSWPEAAMDLAWSGFRRRRELYDIDAQLKRLAA